MWARSARSVRVTVSGAASPPKIAAVPPNIVASAIMVAGASDAAGCTGSGAAGAGFLRRNAINAAAKAANRPAPPRAKGRTPGLSSSGAVGWTRGPGSSVGAVSAVPCGGMGASRPTSEVVLSAAANGMVSVSVTVLAPPSESCIARSEPSQRAAGSGTSTRTPRSQARMPLTMAATSCVSLSA